MIYENSLYEVVVDGETRDIYRVVNKETGVAEGSAQNLPQAIGVAEQYRFMLENEVWRRALAEMYGFEDVDEDEDIPGEHPIAKAVN